MALAPFFDKAALAASHILQSFNFETFSSLLNSHIVGVSFDDSAVSSPEGKITLELAVNLLARLYPRIDIITQGSKSQNFKSQMSQLALDINPNIEIGMNPSEVDVCLVVGDKKARTSGQNFYIGSTGWIVRVSSHEPVGSGVTNNPFGASAAACFGAANIFRMLFKDYLPFGEPDDSFVLSMLNYETEIDQLANPTFLPINIGETHLIGVGAIGNGAIWTLARTQLISGNLHLIDNECVELSNNQRYILTSTSSIGIPKVILAAEKLGSSQLQVFPHQQRWGEYLRDRENWYLPQVAVALDSAIDRCAVQASLPHWITNAWTQPIDLGISRHDFIGDQACLICLYLPENLQKGEDQVIAEAIGMPEALMEVRELLYFGKPVGQDFITRIATAQNIPAEPLMRFADQPLHHFYTNAVCGGIVLSLGGDYHNSSRAEVPMAFQSALAGIMLVAEVVAHAGGLKPAPQPATTKIDLLRPLGKYLNIPAQKHKSGFCICQDPDYISAYKKKYLNNTN